jgi:hypothetical protein
MPIPDEDEFELRRRAEECLRVAERATSPSLKRSYLELADQWTYLADQSARLMLQPEWRPFGFTRH